MQVLDGKHVLTLPQLLKVHLFTRQVLPTGWHLFVPQSLLDWHVFGPQEFPLEHPPMVFPLPHLFSELQ